MKYYIIAGEASGDLHGANLVKALKKKDEKATFYFWGGDLMAEQTAGLRMHYKKLAFMGFAEVLLNIRTIFKNIKFCKADILAFKPDVVIFIDYPGFNMRIAKWARRQGLRTYYYISPQLWAWKENRIKAIKRDIDEMYVILPFEKPFYEKKHGFKVHFVGHPLLDAMADRKTIDHESFIKEEGLKSEKNIIAVLPGSRKQEIKKMLPIMLSVVKNHPDKQFVIAGAPGITKSFYRKWLTKKGVFMVFNQTYNLLSVAEAALVTSGTATLETALFKVPEVVCYKGNWFSFQIAKRIINLPFISLVNLIMEKEVVKELIQTEFNSKTLGNALDEILTKKKRSQLATDYFALANKLGGSGASRRVAEHIFESLDNTSAK